MKYLSGITHSGSAGIVSTPSIKFNRLCYELALGLSERATDFIASQICRNGPLARYVKLRVRMRRECRERFPRHRG